MSFCLFFCSFSAPDIPRLCWLPDSSCILLLPCCTPVRWTYTMHHAEAVCIYVLPSSYKTKSSNILTHSLLNYYEIIIFKISAEKNTRQTYYIQFSMYGYTYIWHRFHFLSNTFHLLSKILTCWKYFLSKNYKKVKNPVIQAKFIMRFLHKEICDSMK